MNHKEKLREELEQVDIAIYKVLVAGQSYRIGSRTLTRADLAELRKMRAELQSQLGDDDNSLLANTAVSFFDKR